MGVATLSESGWLPRLCAPSPSHRAVGVSRRARPRNQDVQVRLRQLDVLRAVAVLLVLGRHSVPPSEDVAEPLRSVGQLWTDVGWIGVDLFFVLSGFLVSGLLFSGMSPTMCYALSLAMYLSICIGVGFALTQAIERPSLALRDRPFPSRGPALDVADGANSGAHAAG